MLEGRVRLAVATLGSGIARPGRYICNLAHADGPARSKTSFLSDPRSLATTYIRDGFGDVQRRTSPDSGITDYVYDARGLITQMTDARGLVTAYTYDNAGRMLTKGFPAAAAGNVSYTYDSVLSGNKGKGRMTSMTDESGSTAYVYDPRGNGLTETHVIAGQA